MRQTFILLIYISMAVACGPKVTSDQQPTQPDAAFTKKDIFDERNAFLLRLGFGSTKGFGLTNFDQWDFSIENCASGLEYPSISETNPEVKLYKGDQDCIAKLHSFGSAGQTYIPRVGYDFTNYEQGEVAIFENTIDSLDTIEIRVNKQLNSPIQINDEASFGTTQLTQVANAFNILNASVASEGLATASGDSQIHFRMAEIQLMDIDVSRVSGQYVLTLECRSAIKQRGRWNPYTCNDHPIESTTYRLVQDTYSGVPCTSSNTSACDALFDGSEVSIDMTTDFIDRSGKLYNGGFQTITLDAPDNLFTQSGPNMLLILKESNSYQFFSLDAGTSTQF